MKVIEANRLQENHAKFNCEIRHVNEPYGSICIIKGSFTRTISKACFSRSFVFCSKINLFTESTLNSDFKLNEFKLIQLKFEMQQVCVKSAV